VHRNREKERKYKKIYSGGNIDGALALWMRDAFQGVGRDWKLETSGEQTKLDQGRTLQKGETEKFSGKNLVNREVLHLLSV